jgi:hypothetical protein
MLQAFGAFVFDGTFSFGLMCYCIYNINIWILLNIENILVQTNRILKLKDGFLISVQASYDNIVFFCQTHYRRRRSDIRTYTHPYKRTHTLPLWAPPRNWVQETNPVDLQIDEVTTGTSLSTETSPPTERIFWWDTKVSNLKFKLWWVGMLLLS